MTRDLPPCTASIDSAAARMMQRLDLLAACSDGPGLTRLPFTQAHRAAVDLVAGWMREAGLATSLDAAATLIGRRAGPPGAPSLLIGSHLDTVRDGGRFDGAFGVLAGLAALEAVGPDASLPCAVEILGFADEEGVRFPITLSGSKALAGTLDTESLFEARDAEGHTFAEALDAFGGATMSLANVARDPAAVMAYLEVHIEQGPVLERAGLRLGIVSAINGATRIAYVVKGRAGHAGTEPMAGRRDALAATAEMMVAIRAVGLAHEGLAHEGPTCAGLTATVGQISAYPGAVNVIPGEARFTLDLRAPDDGVRIAALAEIERRLNAIAAAHGVQLSSTLLHSAGAAQCAPDWQVRLRDAATAAGERVLTLPSGAGHDAMAMGALCPMAMLFVRCRGGLSHHPDEFLHPEDARAAVEILVRSLLALDECDRVSRPV